MDLLQIEATEKTPFVKFDPKTGEFEVSGKAIPQDAEAFFSPILEWMDEYVSTVDRATHVRIDLEYFNISSSKRILFLLYKLNEIVDKSMPVSVSWYYADSDDDMKEVGQDFAFMVRVPFKFVSYARNARLMATA